MDHISAQSIKRLLGRKCPGVSLPLVLDVMEILQRTAEVMRLDPSGSIQIPYVAIAAALYTVGPDILASALANHELSSYPQIPSCALVYIVLLAPVALVLLRKLVCRVGGSGKPGALPGVSAATLLYCLALISGGFMGRMSFFSSLSRASGSEFKNAVWLVLNGIFTLCIYHFLARTFRAPGNANLRFVYVKSTLLLVACLNILLKKDIFLYVLSTIICANCCVTLYKVSLGSLPPLHAAPPLPSAAPKAKAKARSVRRSRPTVTFEAAHEEKEGPGEVPKDEAAEKKERKRGRPRKTPEEAAPSRAKSAAAPSPKPRRAAALVAIEAAKKQKRRT